MTPSLQHCDHECVCADYKALYSGWDGDDPLPCIIPCIHCSRPSPAPTHKTCTIFAVRGCLNNPEKTTACSDISCPDNINHKQYTAIVAATLERKFIEIGSKLEPYFDENSPLFVGNPSTPAGQALRTVMESLRSTPSAPEQEERR